MTPTRVVLADDHPVLRGGLRAVFEPRTLSRSLLLFSGADRSKRSMDIASRLGG